MGLWGKVRAALGRPIGDMSWNEARERLVPLLRTTTIYISMLEEDASVPLRRPFAPFLIECVGVDHEHALRLASAATAADWSVGADELFAAARANAVTTFRPADVEPYDPSAPYPLWHVARNDSYESSRLVMPGWLASFDGKVAGRPIAIVPQHSILVVGGDGDERCLSRLVDTARREYEASPRRISPALYTVDGTAAVVPFSLPGGHPLEHEVTAGHEQLAANEYAGQLVVLQEKHGADVFVAPRVPMRAPDGRVSSFTTWTEGVPTLLPRAHAVAIVFIDGDAAGEQLLVPWDAFERIARAYLEREPDTDPPRWRTVGWPDEVTLRALRVAASH